MQRSVERAGQTEVGPRRGEEGVDGGHGGNKSGQVIDSSCVDRVDSGWKRGCRVIPGHPR